MLHTSHCDVYTVHMHSSYTYLHLHTICGVVLLGACRNSLWLKVPQSTYDTLIPWYAPTLLQAMQIRMHICTYVHTSTPHVHWPVRAPARHGGWQTGRRHWCWLDLVVPQEKGCTQKIVHRSHTCPGWDPTVKAASCGGIRHVQYIGWLTVWLHNLTYVDGSTAEHCTGIAVMLAIHKEWAKGTCKHPHQLIPCTLTLHPQEHTYMPNVLHCFRNKPCYVHSPGWEK